MSRLLRMSPAIRRPAFSHSNINPPPPGPPPPPGNVPPVINLITPLAGQSFPALSNITIVALVTDPDGTVAGVSPRRNGASLTTLTTSDRINVALAANSSVASATSTFSGSYPPSAAINDPDNDRYLQYGAIGGVLIAVNPDTGATTIVWARGSDNFEIDGRFQYCSRLKGVLYLPNGDEDFMFFPTVTF